MKYQPEIQGETLANTSNPTLSDVISGFSNVSSDLDTIKSRLLNINLQMTGYVPSTVSSGNENGFLGDIGTLEVIHRNSFQIMSEIFDLIIVLYHSSGAYEIERNRAPDENDCPEEGDDTKYFTKGNLYSAIGAFRHQTSRLRNMVRIVQEITCALAGRYGMEDEVSFPPEKKEDCDLINVLWYIGGAQSELTHRVFYALDRIEMAIDLKIEAPEFGSEADYRSRGLSPSCEMRSGVLNLDTGKFEISESNRDFMESATRLHKERTARNHGGVI